MGDAQQFASAIEAGLARGAEKKAVVANVMEAARQDVGQGSTDELVGPEHRPKLVKESSSMIVISYAITVRS